MFSKKKNKAENKQKNISIRVKGTTDGIYYLCKTFSPITYEMQCNNDKQHSCKWGNLSLNDFFVTENGL